MDLIGYLNKEVDIIIDRPLNSTHPKYKDTVYPVNYGYIPNTKNDDSEEIDVYVLGIDKPLKTFNGKVIAIIYRLNDNDDKLIAAPKNYNPSDNEIQQAVEFQEKYFKYKILR